MQSAKEPTNKRWNAVPSVLICLRIALGPTLLFAATDTSYYAWIPIILITALLSDIFDGVIARKIGVATERLRVADSQADFWFYMWVCGSVWARSSDIIVQFKWPIVCFVCIDASSYAVDLIKYRRIATFHAYTAKIWGLALFAATTALLVFHKGGIYLSTAIAFGFLATLDGLVIKLLLPVWRHDVLSCWHAYRLIKAGQATVHA